METITKHFNQNIMNAITVEQVHQEFFTAADRLLSVYNETERKRMSDKIDRLGSLGFRNCVDVRKAPIVNNISSIAHVIEKYEWSHPNNKVIARTDVAALCEKYNLVYGPIDRYNGFVPEKNLKEIEKFYHKDYNTWVLTRGGSVIGEFFTEVAARAEMERLEDETAKTKRNRSMIDYAFSMSFLTRFGINRKADFIIAAPKKDMIVRDTEQIVDGEIQRTHVPDPVVLFPIESDCYLIVTAWGEEASDPLVVNEKMN